MKYCKKDECFSCYEDCSECRIDFVINCSNDCSNCHARLDIDNANIEDYKLSDDYSSFNDDFDDEAFVNQNEINLKVNNVKESYDEYNYDIFPSLLEKENKFLPKHSTF